MNKFIFIAGPEAGGKTILITSKLYDHNASNFFDHGQPKLMARLYAPERTELNDLTLAAALKNAISQCIENDKDFLLQIHFINDQLSQINTYLHQYKSQFEFHAHFITVQDIAILKERANKRELLGGHSSGEKAIEKSFSQSFRNFIQYLPKLARATFWNNSKEFGFAEMQTQVVADHGTIVYENPNITAYASGLHRDIRSALEDKLIY